MTSIRSVAELTELGRVRLSEHFFMRDILYIEVASFHGLQNLPEDLELAITFHDGMEGGLLTKAGMANFEGDHSAFYAGFPAAG